MGRKSTRENKTVYQLAREKQGYTIEKAGELMQAVTPERVVKIENGTARVQPEDVMLMAQCYKDPMLCNYYCTHECAIGKEYIDEIEPKSFSQIAIETLNALNKLSKQKDRLLEIVEDGQVQNDEVDDFLIIKNTLDKISVSVSTLQMWVDKQIAEGKLEKKIFS